MPFQRLTKVSSRRRSAASATPEHVLERLTPPKPRQPHPHQTRACAAVTSSLPEPADTGEVLVTDVDQRRLAAGQHLRHYHRGKPSDAGRQHVQEDERAQALDLPNDPDHGRQEVEQHEPGDQTDTEGGITASAFMSLLARARSLADQDVRKFDVLWLEVKITPFAAGEPISGDLPERHRKLHVRSEESPLNSRRSGRLRNAEQRPRLNGVAPITVRMRTERRRRRAAGAICLAMARTGRSAGRRRAAEPTCQTLIVGRDLNWRRYAGGHVV